MSLKELQLPSIATLRAVAALKSQHLAPVRPARIGLGFESGAANHRTLLGVERILGGPGRLSLPYSLRWLLDVLTGLGVLHRTLGFVHGEVQPEHVVLGEDGVGRLVPVVRAHWVRGEERAPERLYYLAPEKLLGDRVDARSDVFSVGVMLWEALQGQPLLEALEIDDIIARLMGGGIPRPVAPEREAWTLPLGAVAERAISVDPARRFASVAEMKDSIESACHRYLASAPGMAELYRDPERRARSHVRDSLPPDSQRATLPPAFAHRPTIEASTPVSEATVGSRPSLAAYDLEEELTTKPRAVPHPPTAPLPIARPQRHVDTLVGVSPPDLSQRDSYGPDSVTTPFARTSASIAPRVVVPVGELSDERTPSSAAPRLATAAVRAPAPGFARSPTPQPAPLAAMPPAAHVAPASPVLAPASPVLAPASPMLAPPQPLLAPASPVLAPPQPLLAEPSFELVRPRRRRGAIWLTVGIAAGVGLLAARPWLARWLSAESGAPPHQPAPGAEAAAARPDHGASPGAQTRDAPSPAERSSIGIASTPPSPTDRAPGARSRGAAREEPVVIRDSVDATYPEPAPPAPEPDPTPPLTPLPDPVVIPQAPTAPQAPTTKPDSSAVSDADRYGI